MTPLCQNRCKFIPHAVQDLHLEAALGNIQRFGNGDRAGLGTDVVGTNGSV